MLIQPDPFSVTMLRAELRALLAFASRDDTRRRISSVVFRHDGAFATDGVTAIAGHWPEPLPDLDSIMLARYPLKRLLRGIPTQGGGGTMALGASWASMTSRAAASGCMGPPWRLPMGASAAQV